MGFLHYLDVAIGFSLGMVVLSTIVGSFSAMVLGVIQSRRRHLQGALESVVLNIGGLSFEESSALVQKVLKDRFVKVRSFFEALEQPSSWMNLPGKIVQLIRGLSSETIQREELALMILRLAGEGDSTALKALGQITREEALAKLREVEVEILKEEAGDPDAPAHVWRTKALSTKADALASRLFVHFDNVMDRVEDNVAASGKVASAVLAGAFLCLFPVNTFTMLNSLMTNDKLRADLVQIGEKLQQTPGNEDVVAALNQRVKESELFGMNFDQQWKLDPIKLKQPGVWVTWILLSLGAPFWQRALDKLFGLKTLMQQRTTQARTIRDTRQTT